MGKITVEAWYPEPKVYVKGKYSREITIDTIKKIVANLKSVHGRSLMNIEIMYDKRKDGLVVTPHLWKHDTLSFKNRGYNDIYVFYMPIRKYSKGTVTVEEGKEVVIPLSEIEELMVSKEGAII